MNHGNAQARPAEPTFAPVPHTAFEALRSQTQEASEAKQRAERQAQEASVALQDAKQKEADLARSLIELTSVIGNQQRAVDELLRMPFSPANLAAASQIAHSTAVIIARKVNELTA